MNVSTNFKSDLIYFEVLINLKNQSTLPNKIRSGFSATGYCDYLRSN